MSNFFTVLWEICIACRDEWAVSISFFRWLFHSWASTFRSNQNIWWSITFVFQNLTFCHDMSSFCTVIIYWFTYSLVLIIRSASVLSIVYASGNHWWQMFLNIFLNNRQTGHLLFTLQEWLLVSVSSYWLVQQSGEGHLPSAHHGTFLYHSENIFEFFYKHQLPELIIIIIYLLSSIPETFFKKCLLSSGKL